MKVLLKIVSVLQAAVLLAVSIGASVSTHYCNGNLIDFAINKRAKSCKVISQNQNADCGFKKRTCCEDGDWLLVLKTNATEYDLDDIGSFAPIFLLKEFNETSLATRLVTVVTHLSNAPPNSYSNTFQILFQIFLI